MLFEHSRHDQLQVNAYKQVQQRHPCRRGQAQYQNWTWHSNLQVDIAAQLPTGHADAHVFCEQCRLWCTACQWARLDTSGNTLPVLAFLRPELLVLAAVVRPGGWVLLAAGRTGMLKNCNLVLADGHRFHIMDSSWNAAQSNNALNTISTLLSCSVLPSKALGACMPTHKPGHHRKVSPVLVHEA